MEHDSKQEQYSVHSDDYGDGTVMGLTGNGVLVLWDKPWLAGTVGPQLLPHDTAFVDKLERLP